MERTAIVICSVNNYNSVTEVIENEYSSMMTLYQSINKEDPKCKTINNRVSSVSAVGLFLCVWLCIVERDCDSTQEGLHSVLHRPDE